MILLLNSFSVQGYVDFSSRIRFIPFMKLMFSCAYTLSRDLQRTHCWMPSEDTPSLLCVEAWQLRWEKRRTAGPAYTYIPTWTLKTTITVIYYNLSGLPPFTHRLQEMKKKTIQTCHRRIWLRNNWMRYLYSWTSEWQFASDVPWRPAAFLALFDPSVLNSKFAKPSAVVGIGVTNHLPIKYTNMNYILW